MLSINFLVLNRFSANGFSKFKLMACNSLSFNLRSSKIEIQMRPIRATKRFLAGDWNQYARIPIGISVQATAQDRKRNRTIRLIEIIWLTSAVWKRSNTRSRCYANLTGLGLSSLKICCLNLFKLCAQLIWRQGVCIFSIFIGLFSNKSRSLSHLSYWKLNLPNILFRCSVG